MRIWLVFITMSSLLLLPFSGNGSVFPNAHGDMQAASFSSSHNTRDDAPHIPASAEPEVAKASHCNLMAAKLEKTTVAEIPEPEQHANIDCCDDHTDCAATCPADCGHCIGAGNGCSAIAAFIQPFVNTVAQDSVAFSLSNYSLLFVRGTKPPIIA